MNDHDIDRTLADWFHADASAADPADGVQRALEGARRRRPRSAWLAGPGSHWGWGASHGASTVDPRAFSWSLGRLTTPLVVVMVLGALLGGALLIGARLVEPAPLPVPRLGSLAYAADGDIFVADWDGQNPVRIADGPGDSPRCGPPDYRAEGSMWSPDGRYLAYRHGGSSASPCRPESKVVLSDPAGHVVASFPGVGWHIAWSPDSTRVATWLDLYPMTTIGIYGLDGVRQAVLALPPSLSENMGGDYDPTWSPDGASLLIPIDERHMTCTAGFRLCQNKREVWELPLDGHPPRRVPPDDPRSNWASSRSPDGTRVAYVADGGIPDFGGSELVVAAADGSQPRVLFTAGVDDVWRTFPIWSSTGDRIAFVAGDSADLRVADVATGSLTTLVRAVDSEHLSVIAFAPEGDRILFARYDAAWETRSLWTVDVLGSDPQQVLSGTVKGDWQTLQSE